MPYRRKRYRRKRKQFGRVFKKKVARIARKVAVRQDKKLHARKSYTEHGFGGATGSLVDTRGTPAIDRMIAFGRVDYLNPQRMWNALQACSGVSSGTMTQYKVWLEHYSEKYTMQNACLFPVVVHTYKVVFKDDFFWSSDKTVLRSDYTDLATEQALSGANTQAVENYISETGSAVANTTSGFSSALQMLWKDNLYCGKYVNTGNFTAAQRSHFHENIFGTTYSAMGCVDRQFGLILMGLKETRRMLDIKKVKTVTLSPGQQFSVGFKKGSKVLSGDYFNATNATAKSAQNTYIKKGAEQFIFVAYGLMSHDSGATTATNINAVHRSKFDLNYEVTRNFKFRYSSMQESQAEKDVVDWNAPTDIIASEVRPGLAVEETTIL